MRQSLQLCIIALSLAVASCTGTHRELYRKYSFQNQSTVPDTSEGRFAKSGHLLVWKKDRVVLAVHRWHDPNPIVFDNERCELVWVEIPADALEQLPQIIRSPKAYMKRWGCTWGRPTEEEATAGTVQINKLFKDGVKAKIALEFPSGRIRRSGRFDAVIPRPHLRASPGSAGRARTNDPT